MNQTPSQSDSGLSIDWRIAFGFIVSLTWIVAGLAYLFGALGWHNFINLPTGDIGSFLEGAFAPLAFLWLVIGHFMQQKEISTNTKAIGLQEQSARRLELHSQRDSYFKLLNLVQSQLGSIASFHYMSVCGPTGTGEMTGEEFLAQKSQSDISDNAWFIRKMISLALQNRDAPERLRDIFFGTAIRERHSSNYIQTFTRLLENAQAVDTENMISDALLHGSAAGMLYRIIRHVSGEEPLDSITGIVTMPSA
ncbi:MAG: hypothetical protein KJO24_02330 [Gammaproteobacteria bacterium]|nr:hypothetical protein [Gammaproteobacteria bacterium]